MKVLILGSGGREHALAHRLLKDDTCTSVTVVPGNPGMSKDGIAVADVSLEDFDILSEFIFKQSFDFVFVGPEDPLEKGIVNDLESKGIKVVGPTREAAQLESSKAFAKSFMSQFHIPTSKFKIHTSSDSAIAGLKEFVEGQVVVKVSSLAGGKGVVVAENHAQAQKAIEDFLNNSCCQIKTDKIILEERLYGQEISAFALYDENGFINLGYARDYKRVFDNDKGANTGGMGTFSSDSLVSKELENTINREVFQKVFDGMRELGTPFKGILFAGLMLNGRSVNVIEFNVRLGDPETQSLLPRVKGDLTQTLFNQTHNKLNHSLSLDSKTAVHVVMCSKHYPSIDGTALDLGHEISINETHKDTTIYYAGVEQRDGRLVNSGGRVLGVTALARDLATARELTYQQLACVNFKNSHFRKDIALEKR